MFNERRVGLAVITHFSGEKGKMKGWDGRWEYAESKVKVMWGGEQWLIFAFRRNKRNKEAQKLVTTDSFGEAQWVIRTQLKEACNLSIIYWSLWLCLHQNNHHHWSIKINSSTSNPISVVRVPCSFGAESLAPRLRWHNCIACQKH